MAQGIERISVAPRANWQAKAEEVGFHFHSPGNLPYWREDVAYRLDSAATEREIEDATNGLLPLLMEAVDNILGKEALLERFLIPREFWGVVQDSWKQGQRDLYTRLDLAWTGEGPAKLLEVNGDTPTSLFEAAVFQWLWLEDARRSRLIPADADQFNSLHETLVEAWGGMGIAPACLHLTSVADTPEDWGTISYLEECAGEAGLETQKLTIDQIGVDAQGRFVDGDDRIIEALFKLYPWEDLVREPFAVNIEHSGCKIIEPPWKMLLSAKALLPILWSMFEGHPNLLPAAFEDDRKAVAALGSEVVRKPLFGREGQGVQRLSGGQTVQARSSERYGPEGHILQQATKLATFSAEGGPVHAVLGSWIAAGRACGLGIREDRNPITGDEACFVPHFLTA